MPHLSFMQRAFGFLIILLVSACQMKKDRDIYEQIQPTLPVVPKVPQTRTRKVALLLPLTGEHAELGKALKNAAELSLFDNADEHLNLIIQDTHGTQEGARQAVQKALEEKVQLILGPVFSYEVQSILPYIRAKKVPVITFSSDQKVVGNGVYMMGFSPRAQVREVVTYAKSQGIDRLVAFVPLNPYGLLIESELRDLAQAKETTLVKVVTYKGKGENLEEEITRLQSQFYNGVLLPVGGEDLKVLLRNLQAFGFNTTRVKLLGTGVWETLETQALPELMGSWYGCVDPSERMPFENQYRKSYSVLPTRIATLAYDSVSLAATLGKLSALNPYTTDLLTQSQGFVGMDGLFRLKGDGTAERSLAVLELTPRGPQVLKPSRSQF